jgi:hypothetical protein
MGSVRSIHRTDSCTSYARHFQQKAYLLNFKKCQDLIPDPFYGQSDKSPTNRVSFAGEPFEQDHEPVETPDNLESLFQQIFSKHQSAKLKPRELQALILIAFQHSSHSSDYQFILQNHFAF